MPPVGDVETWATQAEFREFGDGFGGGISTNLEDEIYADVEGRCLCVKSGEGTSVGVAYVVTRKRTSKGRSVKNKLKVKRQATAQTNQT